MCIVVDDFDVMFLYYQRCDVAEKTDDQKWKWIQVRTVQCNLLVL